MCCIRMGDFGYQEQKTQFKQQLIIKVIYWLTFFEKSFRKGLIQQLNSADKDPGTFSYTTCLFQDWLLLQSQDTSQQFPRKRLPHS